MTDERPSPRTELLRGGLPWLVVLCAELAFASAALTGPRPWQVLFEVSGLAVVAACWSHFAPRGWPSSPLWPGVFALVVTAAARLPGGLVAGAIHAVGLVALAVVGVRQVHRLAQPGPLAGVLAALVGTVAARLVVLHGGDVRAPTAELLRELTAPLHGLPPPTSDGPPLVLITVDTLRADDAATMQTWRRIAGRGRSWRRAMSTASWTLPAMASALSGLSPAEHGAGVLPGRAPQGLRADIAWLPSDLQADGYRTAAIVTNPWLSAATGFDRGFDHFEHSHGAFPHRLLLAGYPRRPLPWDAEVVVDRAIDWIDTAPQAGWFLWVHLLDPHMPYNHAVEGSPAYGRTDADLDNELLLTPQLRRRFRDSYRREVEHVDAHLQRLLDSLAARGVLDEGVVVFGADHGEEFWDHGAAGHGHSHHGEVVDVAIAVSAPGIAVGQGQGVASLADVASTLRAAAGIAAEGPDLRHDVPPDRVATAWGNGSGVVEQSARRGVERVIVRQDGRGPGGGPTVLRYDLARDPREQHPLPDDPGDPLVAAALAIEGPDAGELADLNVEALRALGYLQ